MACVSSDNSFPSVRQEPALGLWKGSLFLQQLSDFELQGRLGKWVSGIFSPGLESCLFHTPPPQTHTKKGPLTGKQNGSRKPMRSWKFLNRLSFGFSFFPFSWMPIFASRPSLLTWNQIMLSKTSHFLWTDWMTSLTWKNFLLTAFNWFFPFISKVLIFSPGSAPN